jgi:hypothetical protein
MNRPRGHLAATRGWAVTGIGGRRGRWGRVSLVIVSLGLALSQAGLYFTPVSEGREEAALEVVSACDGYLTHPGKFDR